METRNFAVLARQSQPSSPGLPRVVDSALALMGLVVTAPIIAFSALVLWLSRGGSVLFRQERVGRGGVPFTMYKFRTMRDVPWATLQVTASTDERITRIGRILRRTKLDELPELWNVLKGDMAIVGPRPEVPRYVNVEDPAWQTTLQVRPGLSDPVTLRLLDEERLLSRVKGGDRERLYLAALLPWKLSENAQYLRTRTWKTDCGVIWKTVLAGMSLYRPVPPTLEDVLKFADQESIRKIVVLADPIEKPRTPSIPMPLIRRRYHVIADACLFVVAFLFAYLLRFEFAVPRTEAQLMLRQIGYVVALQVIGMWLAGTYSLVWRYIGIHDVTRFMIAAMWSMAPLTLLRAIGGNEAIFHVPISVIVMDGILAFGGAMAARVVRRSVYEITDVRSGTGEQRQARKRVLLIGAGQAGRLLLSEMRRNHRDVIPVGFVDDAISKLATFIHGVKVIGTTADIPHLVAELQIDHVIVTIAHASRKDFRRILDICESVPVKVRVIPSLSEILLDQVKVSRIRDLQIDDLLGRAPVALDDPAVQRFIEGKVVMVTGAGGSIGSELARQVAHSNPQKLLLVERAEPALFNIHRALTKMLPMEQLVPLATDVCSVQRMRQHFAMYRPQIVIHAAAHKHVPLMEENVVEAVSNNVIATRELAGIAGEFGAEVFVLISSDKAVRPTSIMGTTKRAAEIAIQEKQAHFETRYVAVRFGNVIGSAGSVIPIFYEQIRSGGPVTVTHPEMQRYFMTVPEASQLVLHAASLGEGGEIFVLDMGEPVRIVDVAKDVIRLAGLRPFEDIDIAFTGLRPGEKMFEEIELSGEAIAKTRHPKIFIGKCAGVPADTATKCIDRLNALANAGDVYEIISTLVELVPESELRRIPTLHPEDRYFRQRAAGM